LRTLLILCLLLPRPLWEKPKRQPPPSPDAAYVAALATANHFLRAWQTGDLETGLLLLTDTARHRSSEETLRTYFSAPQTRAFEVHLGKKLRAGRYTFPVILLETTDPRRARRRYSNIIVISTGKNDWAVDRLP
jgi:hypothetical protein